MSMNQNLKLYVPSNRYFSLYLRFFLAFLIVLLTKFDLELNIGSYYHKIGYLC
jgi:hypothetical protein